ncbi:MAG: TerB family tellurite resistance protein [Cyclobacteriaceae bacterium]|nr:TerB family tellurite resistance protein [Cyclobacteriaceae bacterium]
MKEVIRKKLNLLVHLAKIDGQFDQSEKEVLAALLEEAGLSAQELEQHAAPVNLNDFGNSPSKADVLYWALRMIKADGIIHADEAAYCKALAIKLNYKQEIVDYFTTADVGLPGEFKNLARQFALASV